MGGESGDSVRKASTGTEVIHTSTKLNCLVNFSFFVYGHNLFWQIIPKQKGNPSK